MSETCLDINLPDPTKEQLEALETSFEDNELKITSKSLKRLSSISTAPPIVAWQWSKRIPE